MSTNARKEWLRDVIKGLEGALVVLTREESPERFVCFALDTAVTTVGITSQQCLVAREVVYRAIWPKSFFSSWVLDNNPTHRFADNEYNELRIKWVEQMIHDYKVMLSEQP